MKIHILSDLHVEFAPFAYEPVGADLCILAGDVSPLRDHVVALVEEIEQHCPVIFTPGNHEYYPYHHEYPDLTIRETDAWYRRRLGERFVQMDIRKVGDITIAGCTLWTDFFDYDRKEVLAASLSLADFSLIAADEQRTFSPSVATDMHDQMRHFLSSVKGDVILTHHAPSRRSIAPRFRDSKINGSFVNDMEDVIVQTDAKLWVHGHTHNFADYQVDGCRVVCNPRGYQNDRHLEETGFDPRFTVEI